MWAVTSLPSSQHTSRTHAKKQISVRIVGCWTHDAAGEMLLAAGNPAIRLRLLLPASPKPPLGSEGAEGEDKGSSLLPPQG